MADSSKTTMGNKAFASAVAACCAGFGVFALLCLVLTQRIDESKECATLVPKLLAKGDTARAIRISRVASERSPLDDNAAHLYAKALMRAGRWEKALGRYQYLFDLRLRDNPVYNPMRFDGEPQTFPTQRPYFHTPARCEMAKYYMSRGEPGSAVESFELAAAFGGEVPEEYRRTAYDAYRAAGAWGRAFDNRRPDPHGFGELPTEGLVAFARYAAWLGSWEECEAAARTLIAADADSADGHFWLGRALLASGNLQNAGDSLNKAMKRGHVDAAFFLAYVKDEMAKPDERIYLKTPRNSLYRPFAVARALEIQRRRAGENEMMTSLREELSRHMSNAMPLPRPFAAEDMNARPAGFAIESGARDSRTPFLLQTLWVNDHLPLPSGRESYATHFTRKGTLLLMGGRRILEVRLVSNLVPFGTFETIDDGQSSIPGWPTLYRTPAQPRGEGESSIVTTDTGRALRVVSHATDAATELSTVFLPTDDSRHYLLAVRCISEDAPLYAGWNWYDSSDNLVYDHNVFSQVNTCVWTWRTEYAARPRAASYVQAKVGIYRGLGAALFNDVLIVPLDPPELAKEAG